MTRHAKEQKIIERFLLLSIAAAILTIALKSAAAYLTGSVGFLSDALESVVNLVAAIVAFTGWFWLDLLSHYWLASTSCGPATNSCNNH